MRVLPLTIIAAAALLSACATSRPTVGPSGRAAHSITCGAAMQHQCWEKAGEVCPTGYDVVTAGGGQYLGQVTTSHGNASWNKNSGQARAGGLSTPMVTPGRMLVECRE